MHITLIQRREYEENHRHHTKVTGHKFSIGLLDSINSDKSDLVGVVICGRPVSRHLDDGYTLEVTRLCTMGACNGCSKLYAAANRAARSMGYKKVIT